MIVTTEIFLQYKFENNLEKQFILNNFIIEYISEYNKEIYFSYQKNTLRKFKLLKLSNSRNSNLIDKILNESRIVDIQDFLTLKYSEEISREIDKEILKKIINQK